MNGVMLWLCGAIRLTRKLLINFAILVIGLSACRAQTFSMAQCERVTITHKGKPVIGVEDMAYDDTAQTLYLSAYDRRSHSKGGIYRLSVDAAAKGWEFDVSTLINDIRPHGIDLWRDGAQVTLSFIDRQGDENRHKPAIRTLSWHDNRPSRLTEGPSFLDIRACAANNLTRMTGTDTDKSIIFTQTHQSCTHKAQIRENILTPNRATVSIAEAQTGTIKPYLDTLSYANGIAIHPNAQRLYVAETRGKRLTVFHAKNSEKISVIDLPGGPDNLTRNGEDIYAALIPNLIRFSRFQKRETHRINSRFAIVTPIDATHHSVSSYDVPAAIISGATVVIKAGQHIWLGSAYDTAIARCTLPSDLS